MSTKAKKLQFTLSNILVQIGIPYHISGSKYLMRAVELAIQNPEATRLITKNIYAPVALEFGTKTNNVERSIRHAIESACQKNKLALLNSIFGLEIYEEFERPCNGELIALLAERVPYLVDPFFEN